MTYHDYLRLGFPVFPVGPDKKPLVRWKDYQTRMPTDQEVAEWGKKFPDAGIGCPTGPFSKLFVIDVDGAKGLETLSTLNYPLPITRISKTPRGFHYFFKWNARMDKYITTISDIQPGIDIRGKGGYVVVPSKKTPDREWKLQDDLADLPEPWYDVIPHASTNGNGPLNIADKIAGLAEGNRHDTFMRLSGKLMSAKLEAQEVIAALMPLAVEQKYESELLDLVTDMFKRYQVVPKTELRLELVEDFLARPEPPLEWMIEGLWTAHAKGLLVGQPNLGKTWVALGMLISYVTGLPCLGKYVPTQTGAGLLIEQEGSLTNLNRRFHMMAKGLSLKSGDLKHLHHMSFQFPKLPDHEKEIIALMKHHGIGFVVFDSLVRFHNKDENSSTDMRLILESFSRINMETGASVLLIHHLGKQGGNIHRDIWERVRGTSDFVAWRDCMMGLEGTEGDDIVQCSFQFRDAENPSPIQIKRVLDEATGAIKLSTITLEETDDFQEKLVQVYAIITANFGKASKDHIAKKLGGKRGNTWKFIKLLESKKLIAKDGAEYAVPLDRVQ
jgi:hypothetical protein